MIFLAIALVFGPAVYTLHTCLKCLRDYTQCGKKEKAKKRKLKWQAIVSGVLCFLFSTAFFVLLHFLNEALRHM